MTLEIALVLGILLISLILFVTEIIRMDVTALLVLVALAFTGIIAPEEAVSGFANPAVITVWAMFILSEGLARTGVANIIGTQVLRLTGKTEKRIIFVVMTTSGTLSALMNNIGVAALMLPVVLNISRTTGVSPSRLLMPLAYGSLLGGLTTLIGTPPNLLISEALHIAGYQSFGLFDFTPIGLTIMFAGITFVALSARWLLPERKTQVAAQGENGIAQLYEEYTLGEQSFLAQIPEDSELIGKTLRDSMLGRALGLRVIALQRDGQTLLSPPATERLQAHDTLFMQGLERRLEELKGWQELQPKAARFSQDSKNGLAIATIAPHSSLAGQSLQSIDFRKRFGLNVLNIQRGDAARESDLAYFKLSANDQLLVQGTEQQLSQLSGYTEFSAVNPPAAAIAERFESLSQRLFEVIVPNGSWLAGKALKDSELRRSFDLHILKIQREDGQEIIVPEPDDLIQQGDTLTLHGKRESLALIKALQKLEMRFPDRDELRSLAREDIGLIESTLSPKSSLAGATPSQINLADRFGVQLLAIARAGRTLRTNLAREPMQFGDSFLFLGEPDKLANFAKEPDFIPLTQAKTRPFATEKALLAAGIMVAVLLPVFFGWFPIALTAIAGAVLMVLTKCIRMEEAYQAIEWKAVFLIAGMLPLGLAIERSGAATLLADGILAAVGGFGPWVVIGTLYLITAIATTIIPTAALVVLMTPIVLTSCEALGIPPYTAMMAVAMAASASFTSPISHPANILVMGPGGYRFVDYIKVGAPLALVVFIVTMLTLPFFWPL